MARRQATKKFRIASDDDTERTCEITITALGGNEGGMLGTKLAQMIGPSLVGMAAAMNDPNKVVEIAGALMAKVTADEFDRIKSQLLKGAQAQLDNEFHDVDKGFIDEHFAGEIGSLYALVGFALQVNFKNFLQGLGIKSELIAKLKAKATEKAAQAMEAETPKIPPPSPA